MEWLKVCLLQTISRNLCCLDVGHWHVFPIDPRFGVCEVAGVVTCRVFKDGKPIGIIICLHCRCTQKKPFFWDCRLVLPFPAEAHIIMWLACTTNSKLPQKKIVLPWYDEFVVFRTPLWFHIWCLYWASLREHRSTSHRFSTTVVRYLLMIFTCKFHLSYFSIFLTWILWACLWSVLIQSLKNINQISIKHLRSV